VKLSIVVPSKNHGDFIAAALESLVQQYQDGNLEVLIQDCESEDQTTEALSYYSRYPFVRIARERDDGQADALIRGFARASGDVYGWLNADDVLCAGAVEHVLSAFQRDPDSDIVYGEAFFVSEQGAVLGAYPTAPPSLERLRHRCVLSQPSVFFRRDAYQRVGGLRATRHFCMDYELWIRFAQHGCRFRHVAQVLSHTRLHSDTKTSKFRREFAREICTMQREVLGSVSPIWKIYRQARESDTQRSPREWARLLVAAAQFAVKEPATIPAIGRAAGERARAEVRARIRSWLPLSTR
jgi:glycosyltransferase involved in cell wall biosynthesis